MAYSQTLSRGLFGYEVEAAAMRAAAQAELEAAAAAIARLDARAANSPWATVWRRYEAFLGFAAAAAFDGADVRPVAAVRAMLIGLDIGDGACVEAVEAAYQRRRRRRADPLTIAWVGDRNAVDAPRLTGLLAVAERASTDAAQCTSVVTNLHVDHCARIAAIDGGMPADALSMGDVAMGTADDLRRIGLVGRRIGSLTGEPGALVSGRSAPQQVARWARALNAQARSAGERLEALERYGRLADDELGRLRRAASLRRAIRVTAHHGCIWAARLAARTGVHVSNAWRTLEKAEETGLLTRLRLPHRSRGEARVCTLPPIARFLATGSASPPPTKR